MEVSRGAEGVEPAQVGHLHLLFDHVGSLGQLRAARPDDVDDHGLTVFTDIHERALQGTRCFSAARQGACQRLRPLE